MLGHAGFLTGLSKHALDGMIDVVKELESEISYTTILKVSEVESAMRTNRVRARRRCVLTAALDAASTSGPKTGIS